MSIQNLLLRNAILAALCWAGITLSAAEDLSPYVGNYRLSQTTVMTIRLDGTRLIGEIPQRPLFQLKKIRADRFQVQNVPVTLVFLRNQQGHITSVEIRQPMSDTIAMRLTAEPKQPADQASPQLNEAHLNRLVGRYVTGGLVVVLIRLEKGHLTYQPLGPKKYDLVALSDQIFQVKNEGTKIEFELGETGLAPSIIIQEGERRRKLIRTPP